MHKLKLTWMIVFILLINTIVADDYETVDYNKLLKSGDESMYEQDGFYENIPDDLYNKLDYTKVDYTNPSLDHTKIDVNKYTEDMGCPTCIMEVSQDAQVKYSESGIKSGYDSVSIPGNYPEGTSFTIIKEKIIINFPKDAKDIQFPPSDDEVHLDTEGNEIIINNIAVNGNIVFDNGKIAVEPGRRAVINDVKISPYASSVDVYFDPTSHRGNYVSFDPDGKTFYANSDYETFDISFFEGNNYFEIEETDGVLLSLKNSHLEITNRDEEGLVPKVEVQATLYSNFEMLNGAASFIFNAEKGTLTTKTLSTSYTSTPLTLELMAQGGRSLLGSKDEPKKMIVTNSNEMGSVPMETEANKGESLIYYYGKYSKETFKTVYPHIKLYGDYDSNVMRKLTSTFAELPPEVKYNVAAIEIYPPDQYEKVCDGLGVDPKFGAITLEDGTIIFNRDKLNSDMIKRNANNAADFSLKSQLLAKNAKANYKAKKECPLC